MTTDNQFGSNAESMARRIQQIDIDSIRVLNPRVRNKQVFSEIIDNISAVGLKRPITVAPAGNSQGDCPYNLVCGQGRLEALRLLGQATVPAIVVEATEEDCYVMSLVENFARRRHSRSELLAAIQNLADRGRSTTEIATKTGLDLSYVKDILKLLRAGEERLIVAVQNGWLPIRLAVEVCRHDDSDLQEAMIAAYENGQLSTEQLRKVRRVLDSRRAIGKRFGSKRAPHYKVSSAQVLVRTYQNEVRRQKLLIRKSEVNEQRLLIIVSALRRLYADENFRTLLRAESLDTLPQYLADQLRSYAK